MSKENLGNSLNQGQQFVLNLLFFVEI